MSLPPPEQQAVSAGVTAHRPAKLKVLLGTYTAKQTGKMDGYRLSGNDCVAAGIIFPVD